MTDSPTTDIFAIWRNSEKGVYAAQRGQALVHSLLSGWPRRSRSMLVLGAGSTDVFEMLWESGFDVTGQDENPEHLALAREKLGVKARYTLCKAEHMPFDDSSFDYAVAFAAFKFWENPEAVLRELDRIVCSGMILVFLNAWSPFGLQCRLRTNKCPLCTSVQTCMRSPKTVYRLVRDSLGPKNKLAWASTLPTPTPFWKHGLLQDAANNAILPFPAGAFSALRIDFGPLYTGTPLVMRATDPVS